MDKELALRTFGYLIGHYKTHNETTINSQEIEAIEFMLKNNEELKQLVKKQQKKISKVTTLIKKYGKYDGEKCTRGFQMYSADFNKILDILNEVSE